MSAWPCGMAHIAGQLQKHKNKTQVFSITAELTSLALFKHHVQKKKKLYSSIATKTHLTLNPMFTLVVTLSTIINIFHDIGTNSMAASLTILALLATLTTVVHVSKNIHTFLLAAIKKLISLLCRNPITDIVVNIIAMSSSLQYCVSQESAS